MSVFTRMALPGPLSSFSFSGPAPAGLRARMATFAPVRTSAQAISEPSTPVPPVKTTVHPEKSYDWISF